MLVIPCRKTGYKPSHTSVNHVPWHHLAYIYIYIYIYMPAIRSCLSGYSCILFLGSTAGATQQFVSPETWTMLFWKEYLGSTINYSVYLHCSAFNLEAEAKRVFCGLTFVHRNWEEVRGQKENTYWAMVVIKFYVSSIYLSNLSEDNIEMKTVVLMFQNQLRYVANRKYTRLTSDVWADTVGGKKCIYQARCIDY